MKRALTGIVVALFFISLGHTGLLNGPLFLDACGRLAKFSKDLFPPDWESLPVLLRAMAETVEIAFAGTLIGFLIALPLAFLASRTFFSWRVRESARFFIGAIRTVPSILYGVIFVVAFGLGPAAGVMGVALYTVGYLGKFFYETFEGVDPEMYEAVQATGANRLQIFRFVVLPETANAVISQILFMFEYNIRASSILGFVGAGGIGYYMLGYVQMLQYRSLTTAILLTFAVVMLVDAASLRIRTALAHLDTRTHRNPNPRVRSS